MATTSQNKKTVEEGKNVKNKKEDSTKKKSTSGSNTKEKTAERTDVNSDVDQE